MSLQLEYQHISEFLSLKIDVCNKRINESESLQDQVKDSLLVMRRGIEDKLNSNISPVDRDPLRKLL